MQGAASGRRVGFGTLLGAMRLGGRVDASALILEQNGELVFSSDDWGAHLAAPVTPRTRGDALAPTLRPFRPGVSLTPRRFEMLSLAARARAARDAHEARIRSERRRLAEAQTAGDPAAAARASRQLGRLLKTPWSESPLGRAAGSLGLDLDGFPDVDAEDVLLLVAMACDELGPDQGRRGQTFTQEQLAMRAGLQLVGCRIVSRSLDGLRLVDARLPFSLRLIGCVIECPILLAHARLTTLDLSGSSMEALDAGGLRADGNVHLRRSVITSPVTFAGARVVGNLSGSELIVAPFRQVTMHAPSEVDHGMLNLSKIDVGGEVTLRDARIWGGVSLRGAKLGRSLSLSGAIVVSPLAVFEKRVAEMANKKFELTGETLPEDMAYGLVDRELAEHIHPAPDADDVRVLKAFEAAGPGREWAAARAHAEAMRKLEILEGEEAVWSRLAEKTLRVLPERSLLSAIRADGLQVAGSVFARGAQIYGRFRIKYATIEGSFRLEGTLLRSAEASGRTIAALLDAVHPPPSATPRHGGVRLLADLRAEWTHVLSKASEFPREAPHVALDLRESTVKGGVTLGGEIGPGKAGWADPAQIANGPPNRRRNRSDPAEVQGEMVLTGLVTHGSLVLTGTIFKGPLAHERNFDPAPPERDDRRGLASITAESVEVGGDVDLRRTVSLHGLMLQNAQIGGDLKLSDKAGFEPGDGSSDTLVITCENRAAEVAGQINLTGAVVGGDVFLTFDPKRGPDIKAGLLSAKGRLEIYPQSSDASEATFALDPVCDHRASDPAEDTCGICLRRKVAEPNFSGRYIDLRHARCTLFAHPWRAWPDPERLSLDGLKYEQTSELGPLTPQPHSRPADRPSSAAGRWPMMLAGGALAFLLAAGIGYAIWLLADGRESPLDGSTLAALVVSASVAAAHLINRSVWTRLLGGENGRPHASMPRAIAYLAQQRTIPNRFRLLGVRHPLMGTYVQAAQGLRAAGRFHAANAVERERLRLRTAMLSWRHHALAKSLLKLVDVTAGYGFDLSRAALGFGALILAVACVADIQHGRGGLSRKSDTVVQEGVKPGLLYALDLALPIDLDQSEDWRVAVEGDPPPAAGQPAGESGSAAPRYWSPDAVGTWLWLNWTSLVTLLGYAACTLFGLALVARVESALANVRE